ncbi:MAG: LPS assembly protein LptD [Candidatus Sulfobium sp.]|jgi:LPS-assembly protein
MKPARCRGEGTESSCCYRQVVGLIACILCLFSVADISFAAGRRTVITADKLEYFADRKEYVATGSVEVKRDDAVIHADRIVYHEDTSETVATGHFTYDDNEMSITAERAEMNLDGKTGRLHNARLLYRKDNYRLSAAEIEKKGENYYYSPEANFTTCDAPLPAWCFKAKKVDVLVGREVRARDASFRIKGLPVFYTPYIWTSLTSERKTGFLTPTVGYTRERGVEAGIPFYWAISDGSDATFVLDAYGKGGLGTGIEYRFVRPGVQKSNWWAYHIKDPLTDKDFWQVKTLHEQRSSGAAGGFLDIDYVNEKDFYRQFSTHYQTTTLRFLQSTGEFNLPLYNSRLYLLSQYWVDLLDDTGKVPQKLPEAGYVLNYTRAGDFLVSADLSAANLWRENGTSARRMDIYPRVLHSVGRDFVLTQMAAVRATGYSFYKDQDEKDLVRGAFEYDIAGHTRLYRTYSYFTHVVEPSIRYHFIYSSGKDLPVFDSTELFGKTSNIELSVLNRAIVKGGEVAIFRLTQSFDTYSGDRPFLPLEMELGIKYPFSLLLDATYNFYDGRFDTITSDLGFQVKDSFISVGQRYNRAEDILMYTAGVLFKPVKAVQMTGSLWYDARGGGLRDMNFALRYMRQCWGIRLEADKKPGDFSMKVMLELAGLTTRPSETTGPGGVSAF